MTRAEWQALAVDFVPDVLYPVVAEVRREWLLLLSLSLYCIAAGHWFALLVLLVRPFHAAAARAGGRLEGVKLARRRIASMHDRNTNGETS